MKGGEDMRWKWITLFCLIVTLSFLGCSKAAVENETVEEEQVIEEEQDIDSERAELEFSEIEPDVGKVGEGAPSSEVVDLHESDSYQIGDTISLGVDNQVLYELSIDEIVYTDMRDVYTQDPGNVILITYTYTNLSDEELMIDDMRFQMMLTDESTLLDSYYLADVQVPEPVGKGESCTAQISYAIGEKVQSVVLAYHDTVHVEIMPVKITVDNLQ